MLLMLRTHAAPLTAGPGASRRGTAPRREPIDWNPRICWQVPLWFEIDYTTKDNPRARVSDGRWGEEGILGWWCAEHSEAVSAITGVADGELPRMRPRMSVYGPRNPEADRRVMRAQQALRRCGYATDQVVWSLTESCTEVEHTFRH